MTAPDRYWAPMRTVLSLLLLAGCPKGRDPGGTPPTPDGPPPADAPSRDPSAPWADPRSSATPAPHDPNAPPTEAYSAAMSRGPYLSTIRKAVAPRLEQCLTSGPALVVSEAALVHLTLESDGRLVELTVARGSGNEDFDRCVVDAIRDSRLPAPPAELLDEQGRMVTPDLAFR